MGRRLVYSVFQGHQQVINRCKSLVYSTYETKILICWTAGGKQYLTQCLNKRNSAKSHQKIVHTLVMIKNEQKSWGRIFICFCHDTLTHKINIK